MSAPADAVTVEWYGFWKDCRYCADEDHGFCMVCLGRGGWYVARLRPITPAADALPSGLDAGQS